MPPPTAVGATISVLAALAATGCSDSFHALGTHTATVSINGTAVDTTKRLRTLASAQPNVWQVTIERGGKMLTRQFSG